MSGKYQFTRELPHNSKASKNALLGLSAMVLISALGITLSYLFWEGNTEIMYSLRHHRNVEVGWPVTVSGWGWWLGGACLLFIPFVFFMQDSSNPSLALTQNEVFINQQMIRNTLVPFSNIKSVERIGDESKQTFRIHFNDPKQVYSQQAFLFKGLVKKNLEMMNFNIEPKYTKGDIAGLMAELQSRIS